MSFFGVFCVHNAAATRGQYLALGKAWRSCSVYWFIFGLSFLSHFVNVFLWHQMTVCRCTTSPGNASIVYCNVKTLPRHYMNVFWLTDWLIVCMINSCLFLWLCSVCSNGYRSWWQSVWSGWYWKDGVGEGTWRIVWSAGPSVQLRWGKNHPPTRFKRR